MWIVVSGGAAMLAVVMSSKPTIEMSVGLRYPAPRTIVNAPKALELLQYTVQVAGISALDQSVPSRLWQGSSLRGRTSFASRNKRPIAAFLDLPHIVTRRKAGDALEHPREIIGVGIADIGTGSADG